MIEPLFGPAGLVAAFFWGAIWGSFGNVVVVRLPRGGSLLRPASHCTSCQAPIRWYDNIPLLSYLVLRGRCRRCGARYSGRYFLLELTMAALAVALWYRAAMASEPSLALSRFAIEFLFVGTLVVLSFIDLEHMILPDRITLPGAVVFFGLGFLEPGAPAWWHRLIGMAVGFGFVFGLAELWFRLTRREGIGLGDGKLLALIAAFLGWQVLPLVLLLGALQGLLVAVPLRLLRRQKLMGVEIPFGPFLALGGVEMLFFGRRLMALLFPFP
jgi:leader peptidase (prepilin peptidase)/N-methyltransferase